MFNLFDILGSFGNLFSGSRSMPTEEKINDNLRELRKEQWFQQMFSENTEQFLENKEIRLTVGIAKTEKIKNNEKNAKDLQEVLSILLNKKKKA